MGSGFKSRGVHQGNPVFMATSHEGGVLLCPMTTPGDFGAIYFRPLL